MQLFWGKGRGNNSTPSQVHWKDEETFFQMWVCFADSPPHDRWKKHIPYCALFVYLSFDLMMNRSGLTTHNSLRKFSIHEFSNMHMWGISWGCWMQIAISRKSSPSQFCWEDAENSGHKLWIPVLMSMWQVLALSHMANGITYALLKQSIKIELNNCEQKMTKFYGTYWQQFQFKTSL